MFYDLLRGRLTLLQHVLDEIDAPAWTIELVAKQEISRAGRGAEAAMNAGAEDFCRLPHGRIPPQRRGLRGLRRRALASYAALLGARSAGEDPGAAGQSDRARRRLLHAGSRRHVFHPAAAELISAAGAIVRSH